MNLAETLAMAWSAIWANKMRAILTMLGMIIGVGAVILLSAVGRAATDQVTSQVESLGSNLLTILPSPVRVGGVFVSGGQPLTYPMAQAIAQQDAAAIAGVAPMLSKPVQVIWGSNNYATTLQGTTANYPQILQTTRVAVGRFFTPIEVEQNATVAVVGTTVVQNLFPPGSGPALGKTIDVNGVPFTVIGILAPQGSNGFTNLDDRIIVPITTAMHVITGSDTINTIYVSAKSPALMNLAEAEINNTLDLAVGQMPGTTPPFRVQNQATVLSALTSITATLTDLLAGVAAISLIVGGIGIMNIMLVSVTERTREIGIRKAVGAPRQAILQQFLVEAVTVSLIGGLLGALVGGLGAAIAGAALHLKGLLSWRVVALAVGFSFVIGVGFGVYPARKAARLHPIDALRFE